MNCARSVEKLAGVLRARFGQALDRLVVFGSVARGVDGPASDIDVAVVLELPCSTVDWRLEREVRDLAYAIELEDDVIFDLKVFTKAGMSGPSGHTPFMEALREEGMVV